MAKKKIILIVGRTSVGKTSLTKACAQKLGLKIVASYTTRPMRYDDKENSDHIFISNEEADEFLKHSDEIAAYTEIGEYRYFTTKTMLDQSDIYIIDPPGVEELKKRCGDLYDFVTVYIRIDQSVGRRRAVQRGETIKDYQARYQAENDRFSDFEKAMAWEYHIMNTGTLEDGIGKLERIIRRELNIYDEEIKIMIEGRSYFLEKAVKACK